MKPCIGRMVRTGIRNTVYIGSATVGSYRRNVRRFLAHRQRSILFGVFALSPLFAVPSLLAAPFFALASDDVSVCWRIAIGSAIGVAACVWTVSQSAMLCVFRDVDIAWSCMTRYQRRCVSIWRWIVISWPCLPIALALFALGGLDRGGTAILHLVVVLSFVRIAAMALKSIRESRKFPPLLLTRSRWGVLLWQVVREVFASLPSVVARCSIVIFVTCLSVYVANVPDQMQWSSRFIAFGVSLSVVVMAGLIRNVENRFSSSLGALASVVHMRDMLMMRVAAVAVLLFLLCLVSALICLVLFDSELAGWSAPVGFGWPAALMMVVLRWVGKGKRLDSLAALSPLVWAFAGDRS